MVCFCLVDCEDRGEIFNGTTACTDENRSGSICQFTCNDPTLTPFPTEQSRCLPNGEWDFPLPCCASNHFFYNTVKKLR